MVLFLDMRQSSDSSLPSSSDVVGKASGLQKDIDDVSQTANHLTVSYFALLAWIALVTVALLAVVVLSCRRWRRQRRRAAEWEADDSCRSTSDASSVCSRPTNEVDADTAARRDRTVLEGVEIGRRTSSQVTVDDALDSLATSAAEP